MPEFRSVRVRALWVYSALALFTIAAVFSLVATLDQLQIIDALTGGQPADFERLAASDARLGAAGWLYSGTFVVSALLFLAWLYRAHQNLSAFGIASGYSARGVIGWWFVPFANLVQPYRVTSEVARSSAGEHDDPGLLLRIWWGLWVVSLLVGPGLGFLFREPTSVDQIRDFLMRSLGEDVLTIGAALALAAVVRRTTADQERRGAPAAEAVGQVEAGADSRPARLLWVLASLGGLAVVVLVIAGSLVNDERGVPGTVGDATDGEPVTPAGARSGMVLPADLALGDCFQDPTTSDSESEFVSGVERVPCATLHYAEVFDVVEHPAGPADPFPGTDELSQAAVTACLDGFYGFAGEPYMSSPLDIIWFNPTELTWSIGDRKLLCAVYGLDGELLEGSARDSGRCTLAHQAEPPTLMLEDFATAEGAGEATGVELEPGRAILGSRGAGLMYDCELMPAEGTIEVALVLREPRGVILDSRGDRARVEGDAYLYVDDRGTVEFTLAPQDAINPGHQVQLSSTTRIRPGKCHSIAVSYGSEGLGLYVDGELEDSDPFTGTRNPSPLALGDWAHDEALFSILGEIRAIRSSTEQADVQLGSICAEPATLPAIPTTGTLAITADTTLASDHHGRFTIEVDDVTLDCGGHTIKGPGRHAGLPGIWLDGRSGISVQDCELRDFNDAFRLQRSSGNRFSDNRVSHVRQGFTLQDSDDNDLVGNTVSDATDFFAYAIDGDNNRLKGNVAEGISGVGFLVTEGTGNVFSDNTTSNSRIGFGTWQPGVSENSFLRNASIDNWKAFEDQTRGFDGDAGTRNHYTFNSCVRTGTGGSTPEGLCR